METSLEVIRTAGRKADPVAERPKGSQEHRASPTGVVPLG